VETQQWEICERFLRMSVLDNDVADLISSCFSLEIYQEKLHKNGYLSGIYTAERRQRRCAFQLECLAV
jgi:hypothetical protein